MADFKEILGSMIRERIPACEREFQREMRNVSDILGEAICDEEYNCDKLLKALKCCKEHAKTSDAAYNLCEHIFHNENCKSLRRDVLIETIECKIWNRDYYKFRENIEDIFEDEGLPEKGGIYVFWTAAPREYLYVGKAEEQTVAKRLKTWNHHSVVQSSKEATKLTIIYPSNKRNISEVEASFIRIIGIDNLEYNKDEEDINEISSDLSERLANLNKVFEQAICCLKRSGGKNTKVGPEPNSTFKKAGIPIGSKLYFSCKEGHKHEGKEVTVMDDKNQVRLDGKVMAISSAALKLINDGRSDKREAVNGFNSFKYKGERITDIIKSRRRE